MYCFGEHSANLHYALPGFALLAGKVIFNSFVIYTACLQTRIFCVFLHGDKVRDSE